MPPTVARAIEAIRRVPWRGIEFVRPPDAETTEPPRPGRRGPTAARRPLGETTARLLAWLRAHPGEHRTRDLADGVGENSRRICAAMEPLVERGLVARRPAGREGGPGRAGMVYRALGVALALAAGSGGAQAHENAWYGGLRSPTGVPCCNDRDCRRLDACTLPDGKQGVAANGGCWSIPYDKVLPGLSSPDGEMHGCFPNSAGKPVWLCFVMPGAA